MATIACRVGLCHVEPAIVSVTRVLAKIVQGCRDFIQGESRSRSVRRAYHTESPRCGMLRGLSQILGLWGLRPT